MKWFAISFLIAFLPIILGYASIQFTFHVIDLLNRWVERVEKREKIQ